MNIINFDHALDIYKSIKAKGEVTNDLGQLYFTIALLGDEVVRLQKELAAGSTQRITKKKSN